MPTSIEIGNFVVPGFQPENDLRYLPHDIGAEVFIGSADIDLRFELEGRGFFPSKFAPNVYLMRRDLHDGALTAQR